MIRPLICLLVLVPAVASTRAGEAEEKTVLHLAVGLTDGSRIMGTPGAAKIQIRTTYATMDIPLKRIATIEMNKDRETAAVLFINGDKLQGVPALESLELKTLLGDISIGIAHITRIDVMAGGTADAGLLLHYPFDDAKAGRATDASEQKRHGTLRNACSYVAGVRGKGLRIQGHQSTFGDRGGHVILPELDLAETKSFSISLWVSDELIPNPQGEAYVNFGTHGKGLIHIGNYYNDLSFHVGKVGIKTPLDKADQGKFIHCCLVYRNGEMFAYKNGKLLGKKETTVDFPTDRGALGRHWWYDGAQTSTRLTATFDELRIYGRALSGTEVSGLYDDKR